MTGPKGLSALLHQRLKQKYADELGGGAPPPGGPPPGGPPPGGPGPVPAPAPVAAPVSFTTLQLAAEIERQRRLLEAIVQAGEMASATDFRPYFDGLNAWIDANRAPGSPPFSSLAPTGMTDANGGAIVYDNAKQSGLSDAFDDVRTFIGQPTFRAAQAADRHLRLAGRLPTF